MQRIQNILTATMLLFFLATLIKAAETDAAEVQVLPPVVVSESHWTSSSWSADKIEELPAHERFAIPQSAEATQQIFTQEDIEEMRPDDVYDLIDSAMGMSIMRQGARVHNFAKSRGDTVNIIIDGVYLSSSEARRILGDLPVSMIESVRFFRDATVLTMGPLTGFGSAAATPNQGFIVITTRSADDGRETELRGSYASYSTVNGSIFHGDSIFGDRLKLGLGYAKAKTDGRSDWNNEYDGDSFFFNFGYEAERFTSRAMVYVNKASRHVQRAVGTYSGTTNYPTSGPTPAGVMDQHIWRYDPVDTAVVSYQATANWSDSQVTALTFGFSEATGTAFYDTIYDDGDPRDFTDRVREFHLTHTITSDKNTLKVGAQALMWYMRTEGSTTPREEESYGGYLYDEYRLTDKLILDGAIRADAKKVVEGGDKYLDNGNEVELSDDEWTDEAYALSLGLSYQWTPACSLFGRFSYNNTPSSDTLTSVDNKDLDDERRLKYEVGINTAWWRALNMSLTAFYYDIDGSKVSDGAFTVIDPDDPTYEETVTIYTTEDISRQGIEAAVSGQLLNHERWGRLNYELSYTWFDEDNPNITTETPENKYSGRLSYQLGDYRASLSILKVDPYTSYDYTVGDYTLINANLSRAFVLDDCVATVALFGRNLKDDDYATFNKGYPARANWGTVNDIGAVYGMELTVTF